LRLAAGDAVPLRDLQAELDLSDGGARALAQALAHEALVRREPVPMRPHEIALRLAPGARLELAAALGPLADRIDAITARLSAADRRTVADYLTELAGCLPRGPAAVDDHAGPRHQR
jgi:hypothetical protein